MPQHILVCDDHSHITRLLELVLKREGFEVHVEQDGQAAWEAILHDPPDLLITDQEMPGLTGLELVRNIRKHSRLASLPVILLTARAFELRQSYTVQELDLLSVYTKPFSPRELTSAVKRILRVPERPLSTLDQQLLPLHG